MKFNESFYAIVVASGYFHLIDISVKLVILNTCTYVSITYPSDRLQIHINYSIITSSLLLGAALSHSPIGLAAYILEKFITFYPDHDVDALLDNIMIYYLSNSITTAVRLYSEALTKDQNALGLMQVPTSVPTACARFWNDIAHSLDWQLRDKYTKLMQSTYYENGGHFAAMEVPHVLLKDFLKFVNLLFKN